MAQQRHARRHDQDDTVFVVGAFDRGERRVVERLREIHSGDLGAEHGCGRNNFHGASTSTTTRRAGSNVRLIVERLAAGPSSMVAYPGRHCPWISTLAYRMVRA